MFILIDVYIAIAKAFFENVSNCHTEQWFFSLMTLRQVINKKEGSYKVLNLSKLLKTVNVLILKALTFFLNKYVYL